MRSGEGDFQYYFETTLDTSWIPPAARSVNFFLQIPVMLKGVVSFI